MSCLYAVICTFLVYKGTFFSTAYILIAKIVVAPKQLYDRLCPSVCPPLGPSRVGNAFSFWPSKSDLWPCIWYFFCSLRAAIKFYQIIYCKEKRLMIPGNYLSFIARLSFLCFVELTYQLPSSIHVKKLDPGKKMNNKNLKKDSSATREAKQCNKMRSCTCIKRGLCQIFMKTILFNKYMHPFVLFST